MVSSPSTTRRDHPPLGRCSPRCAPVRDRDGRCVRRRARDGRRDWPRCHVRPRRAAADSPRVAHRLRAAPCDRGGSRPSRPPAARRSRGASSRCSSAAARASSTPARPRTWSGSPSAAPLRASCHASALLDWFQVHEPRGKRYASQHRREPFAMGLERSR